MAGYDKLTTEEKLSSYIDALRPIIYIQSNNFDAVDTLISGAAQDRQVYEWNDAAGSVDFKHKICTSAAPMTLSDFLETFNDNAPRQAFIVLKDVQHYFERESKYYDAKAIALIKSIARRIVNTEGYEVTVFLVCSTLVLPPELRSLITVFDIPLPRDSETDCFAIS